MEALLNQFRRSTNTKEENYELEARIGNNLTKIDYNQVIQWLLLSGFVLENKDGVDLMRIVYQKTNESVRAELTGIKAIQRYCKTAQMVNPTFSKKRLLGRHEIRDYWTNVALSLESTSEETTLPPSSFRFMNRVRLTSPKHSFYYDCSIVRTSTQIENLFTQDPTYEIECEFVEKDNLMQQIQQAITFVLRGLQDSYYPISMKEMNEVQGHYKKTVAPAFIGPNLVTLQEENLHGDGIFKTHCVTDKADGQRKLLFVCDDKVYYIVGNSLQVQWTGSKVEGLNGTLLDGEHVLYTKERERMNSYFAFDIYYHKLKKAEDVRKEPFLVTEAKSSRYARLLNAVHTLNERKSPTFVLDVKKFYPCTYDACKDLLQKEYPYHTDGLIFTPMDYGVGMSKDDDKVKDFPFTWEINYKWKPAEENTIDFLIQMDKEQVNPDPADPYTYQVLKLYVHFSKADIYANPVQSIFHGYEVNEPKESNVLFKPSEPLNEIGGPIDEKAHLCHVKSVDGVCYTELREVLENNMIVECRYDKGWIPMRVRWDKMKQRRANAFRVAASNWYTIHRPVTTAMLTAPSTLAQYYEENTDRTPLRKFHNFVKTQLLSIIKDGQIVLDFAVGRGGDLNKWKKASFVLGIDIDENNIVNKKWGVCSRYLKGWEDKLIKNRGIFIQGDCGLRIKTGEAIRGQLEKTVVRSIFGTEPKRAISKGVDLHYGKGIKGFHVTSIQFAVHYLFGSPIQLSHFLQNVAECTALHGYFVGTCYDGTSVFQRLKDKSEGETYAIQDKGNTICTIRKKYKHGDVDMNDSCLGYKIGVKQTSIGTEHDEYLVFFPYFIKIMEQYGFEWIEGKEFDTYYKEYPGLKMSTGEQELSFLNRAFVFQKKKELVIATKEYLIRI
jgi:hypothetical protein